MKAKKPEITVTILEDETPKELPVKPMAEELSEQIEHSTIIEKKLPKRVRLSRSLSRKQRKS